MKRTPRAPGLSGVGSILTRNARDNLDLWIRILAPPPRLSMFRPHLPAMAATVATLVAVVASMFLLDAAASDWARHEPSWFRAAFEKITNFGLGGWFLVPFGFIVLCLAAIKSPKLPPLTQGVLAALAVRFGFLFLAVGVPGLFVTIVKRLIGRARPYVGSYDDPFAYMPFIWRSEYASMPSGHATNAAAAAIAIGAIWPSTRGVMWVYAIIIMLSRVFVFAHHPSDVVAGVLVGVAGACLVRRWFAGRRLLFCARDLRAYPGPSLRRIRVAIGEAIVAL